jgi:hypothetical protein
MIFIPSFIEFRLVVQNYYVELTDERKDSCKSGCEGKISVNFLNVECALIYRPVSWEAVQLGLGVQREDG